MSAPAGNTWVLPGRREEKDALRKFLLAFLLSLAVHAPLLVLLGLVLAFEGPPQRQYVEIVFDQAPDPSPDPEDMERKKPEREIDDDESLLGMNAPRGPYEQPATRPVGPEEGPVAKPPLPRAGYLRGNLEDPEPQEGDPVGAEEAPPERKTAPEDLPQPEETPPVVPPETPAAEYEEGEGEDPAAELVEEPEPLVEEPEPDESTTPDASKQRPAPQSPPPKRRLLTKPPSRRGSQARPQYVPQTEFSAPGSLFGDIAFDSKDYDWSDYTYKVYWAIYRAWLRELWNTRARFGRDQALHELPNLMGRVVIHFVIREDGSVERIEIVDVSPIPALDDASAAAIAAAVLPPLPDDFPRSEEGVTFGFRLVDFYTAEQLEMTLRYHRSQDAF